MHIALCVLATQTPTHLQVMDDGIAAQYANKGPIFYHGQPTPSCYQRVGQFMQEYGNKQQQR